MWRLEEAPGEAGMLRWSRIAAPEGELSFGQVGEAWRTSAAFRAFWISRLRSVPLAAYCWECPPVSDASRARRFECVFVPSPSLARMPQDSSDFAEHFRAGCRVVTFANLGGDALLVAPCPDGSGEDYAHLASFTTSAPDALQHALWQAVGGALEARMGPQPLWLSTAGHGVGWLHVRLDSVPKYYRHGPYARN
jgi:hypothetical protein